VIPAELQELIGGITTLIVEEFGSFAAIVNVLVPELKTLQFPSVDQS